MFTASTQKCSAEFLNKDLDKIHISNKCKTKKD